MDNMKQKLVESIRYRLVAEIAPQNKVKFLLDMEPTDIVEHAISVIYLYTRVGKGRKKQSIFMSGIVSAIGHGLRTKMKLRKDSAIAAKAGAFILYTFESLGLLKARLGQGENGHGAYVVEILEEEVLGQLWADMKNNKTEKIPSTVPHAPWVKGKHANGMSMVKTLAKDVIEQLTPEEHPIVFDCLNRAQETGWRINEEIYHIYVWALKYRTAAFSSIWDMQDPEAKSSKIREAVAIGSIAKQFLNKTFYHLYYYDFRGRKYPATAYLHEQGTDLAKGLLLRDDCKKIGKEGFDWLLISIASNWAGDSGRPDEAKTDKIPLLERVTWTLDNEEILMSYVSNPKVNQGWMKADKPWQFLAACIELNRFRKYQSNIFPDSEDILYSEELLYGYESHLECYIDGSNNGSQHLSALTKDEITAPYVNLVPLDLPGDLYKYIAGNVWAKIESDIKEVPPNYQKECEVFIDTILDLKQQTTTAPLRSERGKELIAQANTFRNANKKILADAAVVFWNKITDVKHRRKIVKRNVMTLPYGGTAYGLGDQQIDDARKHKIDILNFMEQKWGAYMGKAVFDDCQISLKRPMRLLTIFEEAGKRAEKENRFLSWKIPITKFPVVQYYVEGKVKKIYVQYGPPVGERNSTGYYDNTIQMAITFIEDTIPSKRKQALGASPNAIHSLDAAHLMLISYRSDFPVTTVHDSFGCLLGDMPKLFRIVRETFVELYSADPLTCLMDQIGGDLSAIEIGNLDINLILDSEYAFC